MPFGIHAQGAHIRGRGACGVYGGACDDGPHYLHLHYLHYHHDGGGDDAYDAYDARGAYGGVHPRCLLLYSL